MNQRTEELIGQALDRAIPQTWTVLSRNDLERFAKEFSKLVVADIVDKLDQEIDTATDQGEIWTASTLQAFSLDILDHFDMELDNGTT